MSDTPDRDAVLNALASSSIPTCARDIVSLGFVKDLAIDRRPRLVHASS